MNRRAVLAGLNDLDGQLCSAFGISRPGDAITLDEAVAMSAAPQIDCWTGECCVDNTASPVQQSLLTALLQARITRAR